MATHLKVNGDMREVEPKEGYKFTLEELQGFVNGLIEEIRFPDGSSILVNEEFLFNGSEHNVNASFFAGQPICDDALLIEEGEWS